MLVNAGRFIKQVIGTNYGCVATCVAATKPAFFDNGNIGDTAFLSQVVGRREAVATAADDYNVIV